MLYFLLMGVCLALISTLAKVSAVQAIRKQLAAYNSKHRGLLTLVDVGDLAFKTIWQNDTLAMTEKEDLTALLLSGHDLSYIRLDKNIHDHHNEFHEARYVGKFGHGDSTIDFFGRVAQAIKKGSNGKQYQHRYCTLSGRDNWLCTGQRYEHVLRNTLHFNRSLSLDAFPDGTRIFVEGNSYLAQKVSVILCGSSDSDTKFWQLDSKVANSVLAYNPERDVGLLMLDNDDKWNKHFNLTAELLRSIWLPTLIVLGNLNFPHHERRRAPDYKDAFPGVPVIACVGRGLPHNCGALDNTHNGGFGACVEHKKRGSVHECVPGPINRYAEHMARLWLGEININLKRSKAGSKGIRQTNSSECYPHDYYT